MRKTANNGSVFQHLSNGTPSPCRFGGGGEGERGGGGRKNRWKRPFRSFYRFQGLPDTREGRAIRLFGLMVSCRTRPARERAARAIGSLLGETL